MGPSPQERKIISIDGACVLKVDGQCYRITAVGGEVPTTLAGLGHCSFKFSGQTEVELRGTIYVEDKPMPDIQVGTVLQIVEE